MTSGHRYILQRLADNGPTKASFFREEELDALFKLRPRLIELAGRYDDPVVDITATGRKALVNGGIDALPANQGMAGEKPRAGERAR